MALSIDDLLRRAVENKASDLHLKVGSHPVLRINGELIPLVETKRLMQEEPLGELFRARITFTSAFPVFDNQPFLKELPQFILTDIGSHILDTARFLFGEAEVAVDVASGVDDDGLAGPLAPQQVARLSEAVMVESPEEHVASGQRERGMVRCFSITDW